MATQRIVFDNFVGGLAPSRYQGNYNGQFDPYDTTSAGWDPYFADEEGLLRRGLGTATLTNAPDVTGSVTWMKAINRSYGSYVFGIEEQVSGAGTNNRLIRINAATHTISNTSPWPFTLPTDGGQCGLEFFNGYLYYASKRYLGRFNLSLTFDSSYYTFLGTQAIGRAIDHPMVQGNGKLFIGNSNYSLNTASIAVDDGVSVTPNALDLSKTEQFVRSLEFHRNTLFIAASSNAESGSLTTSPCTMYVWDGISNSYQDKFEFPDEDFHAVKVFGNTIYGFGQRGVFQFNGNGFDLVQQYSGGPDPWGVSTNPRGFVTWKDENTQVFSYGSPHKDLPTIPWKPIKFSEVPSGGVFWVNRHNIYVGGFAAGDKIRRFGGSTGYQSAIWRCPMLKFDQPMRLVKFEVQMLPLESGTNLSFLWAKDDGATPITLATLGTAGTTEWKFTPDGIVDSSWQIGIADTAESAPTPKIRRIVLEIEPEKS